MAAAGMAAVAAGGSAAMAMTAAAMAAAAMGVEPQHRYRGGVAAGFLDKHVLRGPPVLEFTPDTRNPRRRWRVGNCRLVG
jgi:hypothetical protein